MQTKTYVAPTKLEALLKIREELGADAIILSERTVQKGMWFSKKPMVEIVVGIKGTDPKSEPSSCPSPKAEPKGVEEYDSTQMRLRKLEREVQEIRALVQSLHAHFANGAAPSLSESEVPVLSKADEHPLLAPLIAAGVERELGLELLRRVPRIPHNAALDTLRRTLIARVPIGGALPREGRQRQVAVLVGPTGVGKTTTIAKLAAIHALDYNRKVALISLDTYRIGAVEQLRTYARIMDLPLHVASDASEVQEGLEAFAGYDLVLVDTIGRGQRDEAHLQAMREALKPVRGIVYLTLSATADTATLLDAAQRFAIFEPNAIILTKLDEAVRLGNCINLALRQTQPLAYFTTGQRVPEDIMLADATMLACRVLHDLAQHPTCAKFRLGAEELRV
ncbi:MAG: flagellar biosynthesis protein FlhF [Fimbriimonadales bacterium]|nr:flagellar biosynthesis protein FlhF [Fimbriimonadales bacterium]MDW8052109.1 flagellar biosynthesis protein FlhF [Armatimonadota bacterium]